MVTLQTGSHINNDRFPNQNATRTALSTHIIIKVDNTPVGAIQSIDVNESRTITAVDEVGTDGHIDSAPTKSTDISGSCSRIRYDRLRVAEAFSRGFFHAKSQRIPFDIDIYDLWNGNDSGSIIVTKIKNVWIKAISYTYSHDNWIITDKMDWVAEDIQSTIQGNQNAATGGGLGLIFQSDSEGIERAADRGDLRGAVDSNLVGGVNSGIFNSIFGGA